VAPSAAAQAASILGTALGIIEPPTLKNGFISLVVADREAIPGLAAELVAAGVPIYQVRTREPSLEDIYFALHGEEEML
jgi:hypothetical protein